MISGEVTGIESSGADIAERETDGAGERRPSDLGTQRFEWDGAVHRWASTSISMSAISDIRHLHLVF